MAKQGKIAEDFVYSFKKRAAGGVRE